MEKKGKKYIVKVHHIVAGRTTPEFTEQYPLMKVPAWVRKQFILNGAVRVSVELPHGRAIVYQMVPLK